MKQLVGHDLGAYAFNKTAGTITFSDVTLALEQILLITDATAGTIIYALGSSTLGGSMDTDVLTLTYDTSALGDGDNLQIYVDVPSSTNPSTVALTSADVTTLTPPSASAIGTAVAAPSASAIASAIVSNPPTVAIDSATPVGFHISSNAVQAIKSSAGVLRGYFLDNTANAATSYVQFFNVAAGSVTLGSTAPLFVIPIPAGLAANLAMPGGWTFSAAMSFAVTTTYNGSTAPSSACDCVIAYV